MDNFEEFWACNHSDILRIDLTKVKHNVIVDFLGIFR